MGPRVVSLDKRVRRVLIGYCIAITVACIYVPWKVHISDSSLSIGDVSIGYALIWTPPRDPYKSVEIPIATVDVARAALQIVALTALCVAVLLLSCRSSPVGKDSQGGSSMSSRKQTASVQRNTLQGHKAVVRFLQKLLSLRTDNAPRTMDYKETYARMSDEELAHLAESRNNLTDSARAALDTELTIRVLTGVVQGTRSL